MDGEKTCETCRHFRRHYVKRGRNWYIPSSWATDRENPASGTRQNRIRPPATRYSEAQKKGG